MIICGSPSMSGPPSTTTRPSARCGWSRSVRRCRGVCGLWPEPSGFAWCVLVWRPRPGTVSACSMPWSSWPRASVGCPKPFEPSPRHLNRYTTFLDTEYSFDTYRVAAPAHSHSMLGLLHDRPCLGGGAPNQSSVLGGECCSEQPKFADTDFRWGGAANERQTSHLFTRISEVAQMPPSGNRSIDVS